MMKRTMRRGLTLLLAAGAAAISSVGAIAPADEWQPAKGPLMTRWAADVSPRNALPEYPRPQMVRRQWLNLNGLWQFAHAESAEQKPPIGRDLDEQILVPFPVESALSGRMESAERVWYRRTFDVPDDWNGRRVLLHFGAVDWQANVYVNGRHLGEHRGGYDGFSFEVTDALVAEGPQELVVGVFDPTDAGTQQVGKQVREPKGIWYTPTTGIWQTVWIEPVPDAHIESIRLVPDVDAGALEIQVAGRGTNDDHTIVAVARELNREVARVEGGVGAPLRLRLERPRLWSPDEPFLYRLTIELVSGGETTDRVESYFGMRKIEVAPRDGVARLLLNGEERFQVGPLDQGFWPDGLYTAPTDEALRYDIEVTKLLGFNMTRKHVKVEPARWYTWCDRLGLLVWQDMPSARRVPEDQQQFETELRRLVEGRFNHPSIVMWVVFNEGWGQYDTQRLTAMVEELDPSRVVSSASGWHDRGAGQIVDMHRYPGPAAPEPEAHRAAVLGEFGGLGLPIEGHTWLREIWSYQGVDDSRHLTLSYVALVKQVWQLRQSQQLQAAVYTQLTDVETEANGLLTYDRGIIKVDVALVAAANRGRFPCETVVLPTSQHQGQTWRHTLAAPGSQWMKPGYNDSHWKESPGGFGTEGTPGAVVGTTWDTSDIWLRREFTLDEDQMPSNPVFRVHHDEGIDIYINGVLAASAKGYVTDYKPLPLSSEAAAALVAGRNVLAVHCRQTRGGQYIDVGLVDWSDEPIESLAGSREAD